MQTTFSIFFQWYRNEKNSCKFKKKATLKILVQLCQIEMENWISSIAVILNFFLIFMFFINFLNPKSEISIALGIKKYKNNLCNDVKMKWHIILGQHSLLFSSFMLSIKSFATRRIKLLLSWQFWAFELCSYQSALYTPHQNRMFADGFF